MRTRKVQTKNQLEETLVGVECLPEDKTSKFPTVVLVHGFAYFKEEDGIFVELAKRLAEIGVASYRFDFSGCGESSGDFINATLSKLRDDLAEILKYVKSRPTTDSSRLGIVGQSFGTTTVIALAPKIKSLVLMGSFIRPKEILSTLFGNGYNPEGISERKTDAGIVKIKSFFWKDLKNHDLARCLKKMKYPILLIHGKMDDHVPISEMETIFKLANEPKEKLIIEGADHGLNPKRNEMYEAVISWYKKTL